MTLQRCRFWLKTMLCVLAATVIVNTALADDELEPVSLQLKWRHQFQFAGYYAAVEQGYYHDAGFDVELIEFQGGKDLFEPVLSGGAEFGVADSSVVVKRLQGHPVVLLTTIFQHSPLVLISLKEHGILSPYELVGKKVMFQSGTDDASLQAMLTTQGILPDEYELVPHNFDDFALIADENPVDVMSAYLSNQPFMYREKGIEVQVINPSNYGIDFYGDLLYSSEAYVRKNPQRAKAFRDASLKGWQYALENPEAVFVWLQDKYPSHSSIEALRYEANITRQMVAPDFVALGSYYPDRFNRIAEIYKQLELAPRKDLFEGFVLTDYLKTASAGYQRWIHFIGIAVLICAVAVSVLLLILQSLRKTISRQTRALNMANSELSHQLKLTDRHVIFATVNLHGRFSQVSTALCLSSGYSREELLAMNADQLISPPFREQREQAIKQALAGESWQGEMQYTRKDGSEVWMSVNIDPMQDADGVIVGFRSTAVDITEKKLIQHISETDVLTGLANRHKLDVSLDIEWTRHQRYQQPFSLILLDLDHFKHINDQYGHLEGDKVLVRIARLVETLLRKIDVFGRWGGEEFMIILPQTNATAAYVVANKIRESIEAIDDMACPGITASFGVAASHQDVPTSEDLIRQADKALYAAKGNGRNQVVVSR